MAYRRRPQHGVRMSEPSTFEEGSRDPPPTPPYASSSFSASSSSQGLSTSDDVDFSFPSSPSSLAAKAINASSARRDSSLSLAYGHSNLSNASRHVEPVRSSLSASKDPEVYEYTSMKSLNESKNGFWGVLARKAKSFLEEDRGARQSEPYGGMTNEMAGMQSRSKHHSSPNMEDDNQRKDSPSLLKGLDSFTSSLSQIGDTIGNAFEEGLTKVENRTSGIIQETRRHIRKMPSRSKTPGQEMNHSTTSSKPQMQTQPHNQAQHDQELQLKASRDVAMAMAAKAKLLLRELKTVKADLAFAKERCAQLEEENKILRQNRERGDDPEDDLIRLQLETLLSEKSRLAHENSVYARENRFLREVVEYHQLTMQDVVYLDEGKEEVTEVYPINMPSMSAMPVPTAPPVTQSPSLICDTSLDSGLRVTQDGPFITRENDHQ